MIEMMIGGIFLKTLVLCGILFLVARRELNFEFRKVAWVACGIMSGSLAMEAFLVPALAKCMPFLAAATLTFLLAIAFVTFMTMRFCRVKLWKGIVIVILFLGFSVGLSCVGLIVTTKIGQKHKGTFEFFIEMMGKANVEGMRSLPNMARLREQEAMMSSSPPSQVETPVPPIVEQPVNQLPDFAKTPEWQAAQAKIKVSAVLLEQDGRNTAMVNGEVLGIGDILTVEVKKKSHHFKMAEITTDWVAWDPVGETDSDSPQSVSVIGECEERMR